MRKVTENLFKTLLQDLKNMKIFIIGPLPPYRGGISHSNAVLCKNLSHHEVTCISFKRQFPAFLYAGKNQKDPSAAPFSGKVKFIIDSINPLTWFKAYQVVKKEKPSLLTFQWWTPFFFPCYYVIASLAKKEGIRLSAVCQNVAVHETGMQQKVAKVLTRVFFKKMDFLITLSSSDKKEAKKLSPKTPVEYMIEGVYSQQMGERIPKEKAKKILKMSGKNILFFGFVREYKGLPFLLQALPNILKEMDVTLHIVGEFWEPKQRYIDEIRKRGMENSVKLVDRYVTDDEAVLYFSAVDAVVLPYTSSTESGIIQLAYGINTPVITTAVGGNVDVIDDKKTGFLVPPKDSQALCNAILEFYNGRYEERIREGMKRKKGIFSWNDGKERVFLGKF